MGLYFCSFGGRIVHRNGKGAKPMMSENEKYISHSEEMGNIHISQEVLAVIAAAAAAEVEGVGGLTAGLGSDVSELMGRKVMSKGVRLSVEEEQVMIDLSLLVRFGHTVPDVAKAVQEAVASAVENTSGLTVGAVNVTVTGVIFPRKGQG